MKKFIALLKRIQEEEGYNTDGAALLHFISMADNTHYVDIETESLDQTTERIIGQWYDDET